MEELCAELQEIGASGDLCGARVKVEALRRELDSVHPELEKLLG